MIYDSAAEGKVASKYAAIGFSRCTQFDGDPQFTDTAGEVFRAKPDARNSTTGLYVDQKFAPLNHKKNRATAQRGETAAKARFDAGFSRAKSRTSYQIEHGWNHAVAKQVSVQQGMKPTQYVPCFEGPIEQEDLEYYHSKGLQVCTLKSLPSYNAWAFFSELGIPCEFRLHSDDGSSVSFEEYERTQTEQAAANKAAAAEKRRAKRST